MSKIFVGAIFLLLIIELGLALLPHKTIGNNIKYCDYDNMQIKSGQTVSVPGKCMLATCLRESISAFTCADFVPAPGCHEGKIDYIKPFPECCPQNYCD